MSSVSSTTPAGRTSGLPDEVASRSQIYVEVIPAGIAVVRREDDVKDVEVVPLADPIVQQLVLPRWRRG